MSVDKDAFGTAVFSCGSAVCRYAVGSEVDSFCGCSVVVIVVEACVVSLLVDAAEYVDAVSVSVMVCLADDGCSASAPGLPYIAVVVVCVSGVGWVRIVCWVLVCMVFGGAWMC